MRVGASGLAGIYGSVGSFLISRSAAVNSAAHNLRAMSEGVSFRVVTFDSRVSEPQQAW